MTGLWALLAGVVVGVLLVRVWLVGRIGGALLVGEVAPAFVPTSTEITPVAGSRIWVGPPGASLSEMTEITEHVVGGDFSFTDEVAAEEKADVPLATARPRSGGWLQVSDSPPMPLGGYVVPAAVLLGAGVHLVRAAARAAAAFADMTRAAVLTAAELDGLRYSLREMPRHRAMADALWAREHAPSARARRRAHRRYLALVLADRQADRRRTARRRRHAAVLEDYARTHPRSRDLLVEIFDEHRSLR